MSIATIEHVWEFLLYFNCQKKKTRINSTNGENRLFDIFTLLQRYRWNYFVNMMIYKSRIEWHIWWKIYFVFAVCIFSATYFFLIAYETFAGKIFPVILVNL